MNKTNKILIALALAQLIAIVCLTFMTDASEAATFDSAALVGLKPGDVTRITIEDDESKTIELTKTDGSWSVTSADDYPADAKRILGDGGNGLLDKLAGINVDRPTIRHSENHVPLKVAADAFERRITLASGKDSTKVIYVASGARPQTVHVRRDGEDNVFEVSELSTWDLSTSLSSWIDTSYQALEKSDVVGFAAEFADGKSFRIVRREVEAPKKDDNNKEDTPETDPIEYKWWFTVPTKDEATQAEVETLLTKLTSLRLKDVHGKTAPKNDDTAAAIWTVTMADGKKVTLTVGSKVSDENEDRHAKSSTSPFHAIIASWDATALLEVDLEKLRVTPPAPEPEEPKKK
jgi:hypothetical protein